MSRATFASILSIFVLLTINSTLRAQAPTGTILGAVTDSSGAVIPQATVTVTNKATGNPRILTTNGEGLFSAPALLAGEYEVRGEMQGFRTIVRDATVQAGADTTVNLAMSVGASKEVVTVEAATAQINYDNHTIAGSIERQTIQELPLNGRSFAQLATLEPGVTVTAGATSTRNSPISVSVLGGASGSTLLTLDGLKIMDEYDGTGTQINFSQEMVQEFQLSSVNFDISTGITSTGAVNIVSRSGSNDFHGSGFFYYRDHDMAAYPALKRSALNPNPYFARRDPGFWLGGPILKDKLFFFVDFERQSQVAAVTVQPDLPSFAGLTAIYSSPQTNKSLNVRFDYRVSSKNSLFARYTHDGNVSFGQNAGTPPIPSNWLNNDNWSDQTAIGLTTTLTANLVNDLRAGYNYWRSNNPIATAAQCQFPCVGSGLPSTTVFGDTLALGNNFNAPQNRIQRNFNVVDSLSWQKGSHRLRFGVDMEYAYYFFNWSFCAPACLDVVSPENFLSGVGAANIAAYYPNLPKTISSTADVLNLPVYNINPALYGGIGMGSPITPGPYNFGPDRRNLRPRVYAQDTWKVREGLTINYGLGYEYESGLFNSDMKKPQFLAPIFGQNGLAPTQSNKLDFAPTFGFAWSVGKSGKTVIRGGAGMYWDTLPIYWRSRENGTIGPLGNGRVTVSAGAFTNIFPGIVNLSTGATPIPIGAVLPVQNYTNMSLGQFLQIYNSQFGVISQKISPTPPTSGPYTLTDLDYLKSGAELFPEHFPLTRSYQTSIGVQRDLGHNMVVTADWARRQFENVSLGEIDVNHYNSVAGPAIPKCAASQLLDPTQECSTGPITAWQNEGRSIYEGLLVKVTKRSSRYQFTASYALQNANTVGTIYNLNNYFQSYGPYLPRHNFNLSGVLNLPWKFELGFNSSMVSKTPFAAIVSGVDLSGTGTGSTSLPGLSYKCLNSGCSQSDLVSAVAAWNANYAGTKTPSGATINKLTLPATYGFGDTTISQDLRLTRHFIYKERYNLALFGEVFNFLNVANLTGYSSTIGPAFGQPTQRAAQSFLSGGPRAFQVGTRLIF
jgi:hypothetical protein